MVRDRNIIIKNPLNSKRHEIIDGITHIDKNNKDLMHFKCKAQCEYFLQPGSDQRSAFIDIFALTFS